MNSRPASIVLMSVLMVSAFTLLLVLALSELQINHAYMVLNEEEAGRSLYVAEACLEDAVFRYETDATFTGSTVVIDEQTQCTSTMGVNAITIVVTDGSYTATYEATTSTSTVNLINNLHLVQWVET